MTTPVQIREESDRLHAIYQLNFGGLPRITRNAKLLVDIQQQAKGLLARAPAGIRELRETLQARITLYGNELAKIQEDQSKGPFAQAAARVAGDANAAFNRYRRHFGGKGRWSRDSELLKELLEELEAAQSSFKIVKENWADPTVEKDLELVQRSIDTYNNELNEIAKSREDLNEEQTVSATAEWANELFGVYRRQFAGLPRLSRRPGLLERLVKALRTVEGRMATAVALGNKNENLSKNLELVRQQLAMWEKELEGISEARASTDIHTLVAAMSDEYEAVWTMWHENFANQSRETRDLDMLSGLIDRSDEVARQARELHRAYDLEATDLLLRQARDQRTILTREYDLIQEAMEKRSVH